MLSPILSQANSNEVSLSGRKHVAILHGGVQTDLLVVDPHPALLHQAPRVATALGEADLDQGLDDVAGFRCECLGDVIGHVALAELDVEVLLGAGCGVVAVQPFH